MQIAQDFSIDATNYAIRGNAVLGIRDSGKTYTATSIAEKLSDVNIPFIVFDPIGVWRYLKVGKDSSHKGYPIVVAGDGGDIPLLTPQTAPNVIRAAMAENVSLVVDLYSIHLSKNDWRKIVEQSIRILLYENKQYGLRHVFIEEAAEFVPQQVKPEYGNVFAEIEKLARMGGNSSLGYTIINQRAEQVNKSVLELCDCIFLHKQKGKNSITALSKWLSVTDIPNAKEITNSLPSLKQGECWVWDSDSHLPQRIQVLPKNTLHPDRKAPTKYITAPKRDVTDFVKRMNDTLLTLKVKENTAALAPIKAKKNHGIEDSNTATSTIPTAVSRKAKEEIEGLLQQVEELQASNDTINIEWQQKYDALSLKYDTVVRGMETIKKHFAPQYAALQSIFDATNTDYPLSKDRETEKWQVWLDKLPGKNKTMLELLIKHRKLTRAQLGLQVGMSIGSGSFATYISKLKKIGVISEEGRGKLATYTLQEI